MSDILEKFNVFSEISEEFKQNIKLFHIFDWNGKNVLFVTKEDKVFAFGSNYFGILGFGHYKRVDTPTEILELNGKLIKQFFIGEEFVLALNENNHVFGWGRNWCGQLGRGYYSGDFEYLKPEIIPELENIIETSCGNNHSLALNKENNIFSWGKNWRGQVGCGKQSGDYITQPIQLKQLPKIKTIHCYNCQSFAVTFNGLVYSWGENYNYCLGHETRESVSEPKLIIGLNNVISVGFSYEHRDYNLTYFLTNEGNIYFCGKIDARDKEYQKIPKILETDVKFKSLQTIDYYREVMALSEETVYYLGNNIIEKTEYKTFSDYCLYERQITFKTIEREYIKLGSGGFGTVFKWSDKNDRKEYALKVIEMNNIEIDNEVSLLSKCNPEFVVKYYDYWVKDKNFYVKMELCSTNLSKVIEEKTKIFEKPKTNAITTIEYFICSHLMKELLECVQYLHEMKPNPIIHRNLKPQNILFNNKPNNRRFLKLCDFGFATISGNDGTISHTLMTGTSKYTAPEVLGEKNLRGDYSTKADIYSLGIIVCDLFKYDFNDLNEEIKENIALKKQWEELESLIDQMTKNRYHRRPTCADILAKSESWLISQSLVTDDLDLIRTQSKSFLFYYLSYKLDRQSDLASTNQNRIKFDNIFDKIDDLDSGSFGNVMIARNKTNQKNYAIKIVEMKIDEKQMLSDYQREVELISKCSEEYVVKCFNSWIENNKLYIQMEICSYNLKNIILQKAECFERKELEPMTTTEFFISSQIFKEILDSVRYLHNFESGIAIIHRDLKPANILVHFEPKNGRFIKLADFGLATLCDKTISQSKYIGTAKYMAPEILNATKFKPKYSQKTDIYSLGRILSELLDYDMNFDDENNKNLELEEQWSQLKELVNRMLTTKYSKRPNCADILKKYNFWKIDLNQVNLNLVSKYENKFFYNFIRHYLNEYNSEYNEKVSLKRISNEIIDSEVINKKHNQL